VRISSTSLQSKHLHRARFPAVRLMLWALGWFVWLFSGHVSFMHALF
jgi:hypothetical protein